MPPGNRRTGARAPRRARAALLALSALLYCSAAQATADDAAANLAGIDLRSLPLGDGHVTSAGPEAGSVYVCTTAPFDGRRGGGRPGSPWIHADGTFDASSKPQVAGSVAWPDHEFSVSVRGDARTIYTNDLPNAPTGIFPIPPESEAYAYDRNPNTIQAQRLSVTVPAHPGVAGGAVCLPPGGPIGVLLTGGELYNALDAEGRNAVAHELQDRCWGHPQRTGAYHYHSLTPCLPLGDKHGLPPLLGYAFDGFGIYGPYQDGKLLSNAGLDACHGTTSAVVWDGRTVVMYHYVANFEFPYTLGCYRGTPVRVRPEGGPPAGGPGGPPPRLDNPPGAP